MRDDGNGPSPGIFVGILLMTLCCAGPLLLAGGGGAIVGGFLADNIWTVILGAGIVGAGVFFLASRRNRGGQ